MKIAELFNGLRYMLTNEQKELLGVIKENRIVNRVDLDERKKEIAEQMTRLGLIDRIYNEEADSVSYKLFRK